MCGNLWRRSSRNDRAYPNLFLAQISRKWAFPYRTHVNANRANMSNHSSPTPTVVQHNWQMRSINDRLFFGSGGGRISCLPPPQSPIGGAPKTFPAVLECVNFRQGSSQRPRLPTVFTPPMVAGQPNDTKRHPLCLRAVKKDRAGTQVQSFSSQN